MPLTGAAEECPNVGSTPCQADMLPNSFFIASRLNARGCYTSAQAMAVTTIFSKLHCDAAYSLPDSRSPGEHCRDDRGQPEAGSTGREAQQRSGAAGLDIMAGMPYGLMHILAGYISGSIIIE
jgi:hypothetical protein